jgi:hypothetical protein
LENLPERGHRDLNYRALENLLERDFPSPDICPTNAPPDTNRLRGIDHRDSDRRDIVRRDIDHLIAVTTQATVRGIGEVIPIITGVGITTTTTGGSMPLPEPSPIGSFAALVNPDT